MGIAGRMSLLQVASKQLLHLQSQHGSLGAAVQTLLIGAPDAYASAEWRGAIASCLKVLQGSLVAPASCFGGGSTEVRCSRCELSLTFTALCTSSPYTLTTLDPGSSTNPDDPGAQPAPPCPRQE